MIAITENAPMMRPAPLLRRVGTCTTRTCW
jgi:hypothetical protein